MRGREGREREREREREMEERERERGERDNYIGSQYKASTY